MKVTKGPVFTEFELDGRVDQLVLALALTRGLAFDAFMRASARKDRAVALETAIMTIAPEKEGAIFAEAARLEEGYAVEAAEDNRYVCGLGDEEPEWRQRGLTLSTWT